MLIPTRNLATCGHVKLAVRTPKHPNFKWVDSRFDTPDTQISFSSTKSKLPLEFLRGSWLDHWFSLPGSMSATLGDWKLVHKQANWISDSDFFMFWSLTKLYWWMVLLLRAMEPSLSWCRCLFRNWNLTHLNANVNAGLHFEMNV